MYSRVQKLPRVRGGSYTGSALLLPRVLQTSPLHSSTPSSQPNLITLLSALFWPTIGRVGCLARVLAFCRTPIRTHFQIEPRLRLYAGCTLWLYLQQRISYRIVALASWFFLGLAPVSHGDLCCITLSHRVIALSVFLSGTCITGGLPF